MNKKWLLLDCNYLCHRAKHATGNLSHGGDATGTIYGLLQSLSGFQDIFNTSRFVFCWDSKFNKRKDFYPRYKANRQKQKKEYTKEEIKFERAFRKQMQKLRMLYLPMIGFKNIFVQKGYESDDIMAEISLHSIAKDDEAIIITSDKDLYQCIESNVSIFNPQTNKILTYQGFFKRYGIEPMLWSMVKSLAGCTTDNVRGIEGVGEKRAVQFLLNELNPNSAAYKAIKSSKGNRISNRNLFLVVLPMDGINQFELEEDELSKEGWKEVTEMLGMKSIRDRIPFGKRKKKSVRYEKPDDGHMSLGEEQAMRSFGIRT